VTHLRAGIARSPRVVLVALFAFAIGALRPAVDLVEHAHDGDDHPHVHGAASPGGIAHSHLAQAHRDGAAAGLYAAGERLHLHASTHVQPSSGAPALHHAPLAVVVALSAARPAAAPADSTRTTRARGPPPLHA
jgi:hypothetical protein